MKLELKEYYQVSGRYRTAAAFPGLKTGIQALQDIWGTKRPYGLKHNPSFETIKGGRTKAEWDHWAAAMGEGHAGDHFLRCYATDTVEMSIDDWKKFKAAGGTTYLQADYLSGLKK